MGRVVVATRVFFELPPIPHQARPDRVSHCRAVNQATVTFGMIVLNGEPFTRYNLRAIYPFASEIIIVEGACPAARSVAMPDGHSSDGTLTLLRRFQSEEDPEGKVQVVTAEDEGRSDGFWSEKDGSEVDSIILFRAKAEDTLKIKPIINTKTILIKINLSLLCI